MATGRFLVLINRKASRAEQSLGDALVALGAAGHDLDVRQPDDADALAQVIAQEGPDADAIVIGGGDGTVSAAVASLMAVDRPVGILPLGTANDLALTLGLPADPQEAAAVIVAGHAQRIDVGKVNGTHFLNVASIGLAAAIAERQSVELKQQWGILSYAVAAIGTLTEATPFEVVLTADGQTHRVDAFQIAVGNGVHYGGGLKIAEDAAIDDGALDVCAIMSGSLAELVTAAAAINDGVFDDRDDILALRCRTLRVETANPLPVNTDGEITTETPADFSVLREALAVLVPARS